MVAFLIVVKQSEHMHIAIILYLLELVKFLRVQRNFIEVLFRCERLHFLRLRSSIYHHRSYLLLFIGKRNTSLLRLNLLNNLLIDSVKVQSLVKSFWCHNYILWLSVDTVSLLKRKEVLRIIELYRVIWDYVIVRLESMS